MSAAEAMLELHLKAEKKSVYYEREFSPIPGRLFRFDFLASNCTRPPFLKEESVLVEVQGGVWLKGKSGHSSGAGITRDCEKLSLAAVHGYRVIVCTPAQIKSGKAIEWIKEALK